MKDKYFLDTNLLVYLLIEKNEYSISYSEDLQHNQRIEDKLTVINPLKN